MDGLNADIEEVRQIGQRAMRKQRQSSASFASLGGSFRGFLGRSSPFGSSCLLFPFLALLSFPLFAPGAGVDAVKRHYREMLARLQVGGGVRRGLIPGP